MGCVALTAAIGDLRVTEREHSNAASSTRCEICGNPPKKRALHRDHDHRTGKQRGLLCWTCNRFILGKYATAAKLRSAADYLDRYA